LEVLQLGELREIWVKHLACHGLLIDEATHLILHPLASVAHHYLLLIPSEVEWLLYLGVLIQKRQLNHFFLPGRTPINTFVLRRLLSLQVLVHDLLDR